MSYKVIKTVKGHKYLYEQTSYRENGKVKTHSKYLGAVSGGGSSTSTPAKPEQAVTSPHIKLSLQNFTFNLKSKNLRVSEASFNRDYAKVLDKLTALGVPPEKFPAVFLKHGGKYRSYKPPFMNALVVTAPRFGANREKFRSEYRQALHQAFINTIEREAPEKLHTFKYCFDKAYSRTQNALTKYISNSESRDKKYALAGLKWFSMMNPIRTGKRSSLDPEKLGIIQYGKVKNWKKDYAVLMSEIDRKGAKNIRATAQKEIRQAKAFQKKKVKEKTIFFIRKRKTIRRAEAKIQSNKELLYKLDLVEKFL